MSRAVPPPVLSTGVQALDRMIGGLSFVEFFGEWEAIRILLHRFIVEHSGELEILLTQEFGALDTIALRRLGKNLGVKPEAVLSRSFSLQSTIEFLRGAVTSTVPVVAVVDPYLFAPKGAEGYGDLTPITAALRELGLKKSVAVFNRRSQFGRGLPEGGTYHHHSVPVLVEVTATPSALSARIVKHPSSPPDRVLFSYAEVYGTRTAGPGKQTLLTEWTGRGG